MIKELDLSDIDLLTTMLIIQKRAYKIEAELIGFDGIPHLNDTIEALQESKERFFGYFLDNHLVGFLSYQTNEQQTEVCRLIVNPEYFRKGIGKSLITYIIQVNTSKKILVSTGSKNRPAITLYESFGFTRIEEKPVAQGVLISLYEKIT